MLKQRVITAIILVVFFLLALFKLPALGWSILVAAMVWQGANEWARLSCMAAGMAIVYSIATLLVLLAMLWLDAAHIPEAGISPHLFWYCASAVLWLLVVPLWMKGSWRVQNPWLMGLVGWAVLLPTGLAMIDLRGVGPWLLLGVMATVWMADIAAYFSGRKFGKHKLAPTISPGKTWEGVSGALLAVSIYVLAVGWSYDLFKSTLLLIGVLILSCCWVALSVIGDLFESAIKRQAGVKDSGTLLPGHGGLLDRIDALTSTLPFAAIALLLQQVGN